MKLTLAFLITFTLHFGALFICAAKSVVYKKTNYSQNAGRSFIKAQISYEQIKNVEIKRKGLKKSPKKIPKKNKTAKSDNTKSKKTSGKNSVLAKYLTKIRSTIVKNKYKSRVAERFNLKGKVKVSFEIDEESKILGVKVIQSSSIDPIDTSAIETIKRLKDLPKVPTELAMKNIPIELEIIYE